MELLEPSLFYSPPYDRPIEDEFAWLLVKYLGPVTDLAYRRRLETPGASFLVTFCVEIRDPAGTPRRYGFEITDDQPATIDRMRDAEAVRLGGLEVLYRFRTADLIERPHDCLFVAARGSAEIFSPRGHKCLATLASDEPPPPVLVTRRSDLPAPGFHVGIGGLLWASPECGVRHGLR